MEELDGTAVAIVVGTDSVLGVVVGTLVVGASVVGVVVGGGALVVGVSVVGVVVVVGALVVGVSVVGVVVGTLVVGASVVGVVVGAPVVAVVDGSATEGLLDDVDVDPVVVLGRLAGGLVDPELPHALRATAAAAAKATARTQRRFEERDPVRTRNFDLDPVMSAALSRFCSITFSRAVIPGRNFNNIG